MSSKPRICYLANAASIHTQRWARHFSSRGFEVHVLSFDPAEIPGALVHHCPPPVPKKFGGYFFCLPRFSRILRRIRPEIVHAHYVTSYGLLGALLGFHPFVLTAWGSDVLIAPSESRLMKRFARYALRKADLITSMAEHMTRDIEKMGIPGEKIVTLPFGVDLSVFRPDPAPLNGKDVDIVCTRNFEPVYNVELLIRALPEILRNRPETRCFLIGDGSLRSQLRALAETLGIGARIEWAGKQKPDQVADWLRRAKTFVTPSLSDGNNISLNEAMACGTFPVATDIAANREWIVDGENGFLVPTDRPEILAAKLLQALSSEQTRRIAAQRNAEIMRDRGDWEKNMALMEKHYRRILGDARKAAL